MPAPFRQHTEVLSKSPTAAHGLGGRSPASAEEAGLSLGHVSLATQRKVARLPQVDETLLLQPKNAVPSANGNLATMIRAEHRSWTARLGARIHHDLHP